MINGEDVVILFRLKTINFTDFICATDCTIDISSTTVSTKTEGDGNWRSSMVQNKGYTITLSGLIPLDGSTNNNTFDLLAAWMQDQPIRYRMVFTDQDPFDLRAIEGKVLINSNNIKGPATGFATGDITLEGVGPFILGTSLCSTTAGTISGSDGSYTFSSIPVGTTRIDWELLRDGQPYRQGSLTPVAGSAGLGLIGLPNADYTITFYPVCANGLTGIAQQRTWTVT